MNIVSTYPSWYIILCLLAGILLSFLLYRKDKKLIEFPQWVIAVLFVFRTLSLSITAVLLLGPLVKYFNRTVEKPLIVIAQDNSRSMVLSKDSALVRNKIAESIFALKSELNTDFDVVQLQFGDEVKEVSGALSYDQKVSDYDRLLDELENRFANRNVGGLILHADGIYNQGGNPLYRIDQLEYPVFAIASGDTAIYTDVRINNLRNNKLAFLGNEFPVEFDVVGKKAAGNEVQLKIINGEKTVYEQNVSFDQEDQLVHISALIKADRLGKQKYRIAVSAIENESNILNNQLNFYTDVLDGRQKIALLSVSPHPDIAAINRALTSNENYEVSTSLLADFTKSINTFDLVILHQAINSVNMQLTPKLQELVKSDKPILLIGGGWQNIELQFNLRTNSTTNNRRIINESQAQINPAFSLFTLSEKLIDKVENYPPLLVSAYQLSEGNANKTLIYQKIGAVSTIYPLLSFHEKEGRKLGRLAGEGIWKWSIMNYVSDKNHDQFNRFLGKLIQFLAVKADRSFFRLNTENEYFENDRITFDAQLFNPSYELVNEEEVNLKLVNEEGIEYPFVMNPSGSAYRLSIPAPPAGQYDYSATVNFLGKQYVEKGSLTVKELQLEQMKLEADHNLLSQLAQKSNGQLLYSNEIDQLAARLKDRADIVSISYQNEEVEEVINLKWIFFLILALLAVEWFIRKRGGAY